LSGYPQTGLPLWNDFYPSAIKVFDKINAHIRIFVTDTAHFLVALMSRIKIRGFKCDMKFFIP
jgi:hypothetical protein